MDILKVFKVVRNVNWISVGLVGVTLISIIIFFSSLLVGLGQGGESLSSLVSEIINTLFGASMVFTYVFAFILPFIFTVIGLVASIIAIVKCNKISVSKTPFIISLVGYIVAIVTFTTLFAMPFWIAGAIMVNKTIKNYDNQMNC